MLKLVLIRQLASYTSSVRQHKAPHLIRYISVTMHSNNGSALVRVMLVVVDLGQGIIIVRMSAYNWYTAVVQRLSTPSTTVATCVKRTTVTCRPPALTDTQSMNDKLLSHTPLMLVQEACARHA
jgi:hypothetical protein